MAFVTIQHPWAFTFGLLGNIISFMVFLAPLPTFYRVYRKKTTDGYQSLPYVVALFSAMLWIYYAFLKTDGYLLIAINTIGCIIETIYIVLYIVYAPKKAKIKTAKLVLFLDIGVFCLILLLTLLLAKGANRVRILGWVCVAFSVSVFVAPLSIMRLVIRTKSVEFMPFSLSFFLTLSAVMWFSYGVLEKDLYIALPNVLGFVFGVLQMVLYIIYKDTKKVVTDKKLPEQVMKVTEEEKLPEHVVDTVKLSTMEVSDVHSIGVQRQCSERNMGEDQNKVEVTVQTEKDMDSQNGIRLGECEA